MTLQDLMDETELRKALRLEGPGKRSTWFRVRPFFAPAVVSVPTGSGRRGHRLYDGAKVRELLESRKEVKSGLSRARSLRKVG